MKRLFSEEHYAKITEVSATHSEQGLLWHLVTLNGNRLSSSFKLQASSPRAWQANIMNFGFIMPMGSIKMQDLAQFQEIDGCTMCEKVTHYHCQSCMEATYCSEGRPQAFMWDVECWNVESRCLVTSFNSGPTVCLIDLGKAYTQYSEGAPLGISISIGCGNGKGFQQNASCEDNVKTTEGETGPPFTFIELYQLITASVLHKWALLECSVIATHLF